MGWKYGKNQVFLPGKFPKFLLPLPLLGIFPLSHSSSVCVILWRTDFPERKWKGLLAEERNREIRGPVLRLTTAQSPSSHQPTHPAARQPSQGRHKSTCRSHYCSPSSVFTGMLKIVITSVSTEIFNLDVFFKGLRPSCGERRQSLKETDAGAGEERCNRIWTEMRKPAPRGHAL